MCQSVDSRAPVGLQLPADLKFPAALKRFPERNFLDSSVSTIPRNALVVSVEAHISSLYLPKSSVKTKQRPKKEDFTVFELDLHQPTIIIIIIVINRTFLSLPRLVSAEFGNRSTSAVSEKRERERERASERCLEFQVPSRPSLHSLFDFHHLKMSSMVGREGPIRSSEPSLWTA